MERLCDYVPAIESIEKTFAEYVDHIQLVSVKSERNDTVGILDIMNEVFVDGPEVEIEREAQAVEGIDSVFEEMGIEDNSRGHALEELPNLGNLLHLEGEIERTP